MKATQFTQDASIYRILEGLQPLQDKQTIFSDVIDEEGHQYVDLVMEGGGVLGIALAGYVYVMEQMGIRFLQIAGTSAGAINAMLLAASGRINETKTDWILEKLASKNLYDFVDGDSDAREFVDALLSGAGKVKMLLKGAQVVDNFTDDYGLNPGKNFHQWIKSLLSQKGIRTYEDLERLRSQAPKGGLRNRHTGEPYADYKRVCIVAADVTTETKVIFPEMADLYWKEPDQVNPADFVRASMSVPLFFHPFRVSNIPKTADSFANWRKKSGYAGNIPDEVLFIDGGTMSNFPIDVFHDYYHVPQAPTFGAKLGLDRTQPNKNEKFSQLIGSILDASRHVHDYDFIMRNPDYQHLVCYIETGDHNWLNFNLSDEDKIDLFAKGAEAAANFLNRFDWEAYKKLRQASVKVYEECNSIGSPAPAVQPATPAILTTLPGDN